MNFEHLGRFWAQRRRQAVILASQKAILTGIVYKEDLRFAEVSKGNA
jgi:hypothetical protein